jgi:hypothetical protein
VDEETIDAPFDRDGDGFFDGTDANCAATYATTDCNDARAEISPAATEAICNGVDEDCDPSTLDVDDRDGDGVDWCRDCDDEDPAMNFDDLDGDGFGPCDGDCDETDPEINPDAEETLDDGVDQDCTNQPPRILTAVLTPEEIGIATPIVGLATVEDAEDLEFTFTWRWLIGGVEVEGVTSATLSTDYFELGDTVRGWVTPHDGTDAGAEATAEPIVVRNTRPFYAVVAIEPTDPGTDDTLSAVVSGWTDADPDDVEEDPYYEWFVDNVSTGPNSPTLIPAAFDRGAYVYVQVVAYDGEDYGAPVTSAPVSIANAAPSEPGVVVGPLLPTTADPLSCAVDVPSVDEDGDDVSYSYAWLENGGPTAYNTADVPATALAQGDLWTCVVTPDDGFIAGPAGQASLRILTKTTFPATGSDQTWVVPAGTTAIIVKLWGGGGGGADAEGAQFGGGPGGYAEGVVATTPGETLTLLVGEGGPISSTTFSPAYPAGGAPGARTGYFQGGGGGRTAVERAGIELIVAGGGGGAGCPGWVATAGPLTTAGGEGGGVLGGDGYAAAPSSTSNYACTGKGATPFAGGPAGTGSACEGFVGQTGARNQGADGLDHPGPSNCGGAGGDGFWGGGSGALHAGGGGGSGYIHPNDVTEGAQITEPAGTAAPADDDPDYSPGTAQGTPGGPGGGGYLVVWY